MKKRAAFCTILISSLLNLMSCSKPNSTDQSVSIDTTYTVRGFIKGLDSAQVVLATRNGEEWVYDNAFVKDGIFTFTGQTNETLLALLNIEGVQYDGLVFYLENGVIEITGVKDSLFKSKVKGTQTNTESQLLKEQLIAIWDTQKKINSAYERFLGKNKKMIDSLDLAYEKTDQEKKTIILSFIKNHPASMVSAVEMENLFSYNPDVAKFDSAFNSLDEKIKKSKMGVILQKFLDVAKKTDVNQIAPDFTLNDVNGKPITFSKLRGSYLLLDFWASWCGPCREENPNLVATYKKFHKKEFNIVSVSLDEARDRSKWLDAIKKDQLTWLQLSDLKGWESDVVKLYGIRGIPMNFLLDKEGKIIAKGLQGTSLEEKLEKVLE